MLATYIYSIFQYQACVYHTKAQYDMSNTLLTEMLSTDIAKAQVTISLNPCFIFHMNSHKQNSKN